MDRKELERKIEHTRQKMIRSGLEYGLRNPKTIQLSKQLDCFMNELSQLQELDSFKVNTINKTVY